MSRRISSGTGRRAGRLLICSVVLGLPCLGAEPRAPSGPKKPVTPVQSGKGNHWGPEAVGFRWNEGDSRDDRWKDVQIGRFLASSLPLPAGRGTVVRGLSVRVGAGEGATVCFDTENLKMRAAWTGGFLRFTPARFGLIAPPEIDGTPHFVGGAGPGWEKAAARYTGMHLHGERVVLSYTVTPEGDGQAPARVLESPWAGRHDGLTVFTRSLDVGPAGPLTTNLGDVAGAEKAELRRVGGVELALLHAGDRVVALAATGPAGLRLAAPGRGPIALTLPGHAAALRLRIHTWSGPAADLPRFAAAVQASPPPEDLGPLTRPGPARWTAPIVTKGVVAPDTAPYVVDTLTLPFDNPYRALLFVGGHDFFANGDVALCTVHGDVWRVRGVDERLEKLVWKRYATGLYQPLGLKVVDDRVYVLGRDQITRLRDEDGDGEADFYENFCNLGPASPGRHDYTTCLETDAAGNFYFLTAQEGVIRVAPDGRRREQVAGGFRNPNGLGVGPGGVITVAPQEGEWTPASNIAEVRQGGYHGYGGPRVTPNRPLGYDPPLCWLPRRSDNSSGGQVWVSGHRWGPLAGQMLHLSYGQCRMMLVLREQVSPGTVQGGTVGWPLAFASGVMRGRFSPRDGQLYVSGLKGWTTAAAQDGCLQRVRYTGRPVDMPVRVRTMQNGLAVTFTRPLDRKTAEDPDSFSLEQWNYKYSAAYGSADYKVSDAHREGHDEVAVASATLLDDGKTVFLEVPGLRPVMQMAVAYTLQSADGAPVRQTIHYSINEVGKERMDPSRLTRTKHPGLLTPAEEARLRPGLIVRFEQGPRQDARDARLAALFVPRGACPTPFLEPGPFRAVFDGHLRVPLRSECVFSLQGRGTVVLRVNGKEVLRGSGDLSKLPAVRAALHRGANPIALEYASPADGAAALRLFWEGDDFTAEPVPPTALVHAGDDGQLLAGEKLRRGRELFATRHCARCHVLPGGVSAAMPELAWDPPDLEGVGERLTVEWVARWLLDPRGSDGQATMPALLAEGDPGRRQKAADLAAYLATLRPGRGQEPAAVPRGDADAGGRRYEDLGCISCHRLTPPGARDPFGRRTLSHVHGKYRPGMLESFLRRPQAHHPSSRMPDFGLSAAEAASLAAFLRQEARGDAPRLPELDRADPRRGRELFRSLGCVNCHATGPGPQRPLPPLALGKMDKGCLAADEAARRGAPVLALDGTDREALAAFLATDGKSLSRRVEPEASRRLVKALNCGACHGRDAAVSPRWEVLAEEGSGLFPEVLPTLTWAGEKLRASWVERLLAGKLEYRPRPTLKGRMPVFAAQAELLARGLALEHGIDPAEPGPQGFDRELAEVGSRLTSAAGLDCRQCHSVRGEALAGDAKTQIAVGIAFAHMRERLRPEFYCRFVLDPPRYDAQTKMPKFSADGRTTKATAVYGGDARKQAEALWHYIQSVPAPQPPAPGPQGTRLPAQGGFNTGRSPGPARRDSP